MFCLSSFLYTTSVFHPICERTRVTPEKENYCYKFLVLVTIFYFFFICFNVFFFKFVFISIYFVFLFWSYWLKLFFLFKKFLYLLIFFFTFSPKKFRGKNCFQLLDVIVSMSPQSVVGFQGLCTVRAMGHNGSFVGRLFKPIFRFEIRAVHFESVAKFWN